MRYLLLIVTIPILMIFSPVVNGSEKARVSKEIYILEFNEKFLTPFIDLKQTAALKSRKDRVKNLAEYEERVEVIIKDFFDEVKVDPRILQDIFAGYPVAAKVKIPKEYIDLFGRDERVRNVIPVVYATASFGPSIGEISSTSNTQFSNWSLIHGNATDSTAPNKTALIVDTGVDLNSTDLNVNTHFSRSFVDGEPSADDVIGHGTAVAGVVGAYDNDHGTKGVAAGAEIIALKVFAANGDFSSWNVMDALSYGWAVSGTGDGFNLSLQIVTNYFNTGIIRNQLELLGQRNRYVTISAGNDDVPAYTQFPPDVTGPNIYTVSAMDEDERITDFSNYGNPVEYAAPGDQIHVLQPGNIVAIGSGTSLAAPYVLGIILVNNGNVRHRGVVSYDKDLVPDKVSVVTP